MKNHLSNEKSPYLRQHAGNPVDWHPWCDMAFEKAHREDKPVFLSIGYSSCHWCHVMEKESFEDKEVAALLNRVFVCVKVDREERPDIDNVYMTVCQMLTGSGGWPLSIFMTPDRKPFFAGTYFPKKTVLGRIGMLELIPKIEVLWKNNREKLNEAIEPLISGLDMMHAAKSSGGNHPLDEGIVERTFAEISQSFDRVHGGFGAAPKFPTPHRLIFLLRHWWMMRNPRSLEMTVKTLKAMRRGGIFDQVGYGFHRYSTDEEWLIPHFEKMLYDQALLAMAYAEAFQACGDREFAGTAEEIIAYCLRDLLSPEGAFYTAEDADSEGVEGKFYMWSREELGNVLSAEELELVRTFFNAEGHDGNILHCKIDEDLSTDGRITEIRRKLSMARNSRPRPFRDDKILADMNGLMIAALAKAGVSLGNPDYVKAAEKTAGFILSKMRNPQGRLLHRFIDGEASIDGQLDDYAFLAWGLLELYRASFKTEYLKDAATLTRTVLEHFHDRGDGGFFMSADFSEKLISRPKSFYDGAIPSGNSVMVSNLHRLWSLTGDSLFRDQAMRTAEAVFNLASAGYSSFCMAGAGIIAMQKSCEVVVCGRLGGCDTGKMIAAVNGRYNPALNVLFRPEGNEKACREICGIADFAKDMGQINGEATAYVCRNFRCERPTTDPAEAVELISGTP